MSIGSNERRFGPFRVTHRIGATSLAELYRAVDPSGQPVTVHVLGQTAGQSPKHFLETVRAAGQLRGPHFPQVVDFGVSGADRYWVTELLPAETLARRLAAGGLPVGQAIDVLEAVGNARRQDPSPPPFSARDVALAAHPGHPLQPVLLTAGLGALVPGGSSRPSPAAEAADLARLMSELIAGTPSDGRPAALDVLLQAVGNPEAEPPFTDVQTFVAAVRAVLAGAAGLTAAQAAPPGGGSPRLKIRQADGQEREAVLEPGSLSIGRGDDNGLVLDLPLVSRHHARLETRDGQVWVTDLDSVNGTFLGEARVPPATPQAWRPGTPLRIGAAELQLIAPAGGHAAAAEAPSARLRSDPAVLRSGGGAGPVGVFVETPRISLAPGSSASAAVMLFNDGPLDDHFIITLSGPAAGWITPPGPHPVRAGASSLLRLPFLPPHSAAAKAGSFPVTVRVASQNQPQHVVEAQLTVTVTAFTEFTSVLRPASLVAGAVGAVTVRNTGNRPASFSLRWDADEGLTMEPAEAGFSLPEGESTTVEFKAQLARPRWWGPARRHAFTAHIAAETGAAQSHSGSFVSHGVLPAWSLPAAGLLAFLVLAGLALNGLRLGPAPDPAAGTQAAAQGTVSARAAATGTALWLGADPDADGLANQLELAAGTRTDAADSDGDGLTDGAEQRLGTNPLRADTDQDGLSDGEEVRRGLNPNGAEAALSSTATPTATATAAAPAAITLTGLNPNTVTAGAGTLLLTVAGQSFTPGLVVRWNGADRPTQFLSAAQLTVALTADDLARAGSGAVTVFDPAAGAQVAGPLAVSIQNPLPNISAGGLTPASAVAGGQAFTLLVNGANFVSGAVVRWNGSDRTTAFNNSGQLVAFIDAADMASAGVVNVVVFNPGPGGGLSNAQSLTVANPLPVVNALSPAAGLAGTVPPTLTVNGNGFVPGAVVRWNGSDRPTAFISAGRLEAALAGSDWSSAGSAIVTVANPAPGGGASAGQTFAVNYPSPTITALSPVSATAGSAAVTLVFTGTGFFAGVTTLTWNGAIRPMVVLSSTQASLLVGASDLAAPGSFSLVMFNPAPGGGLSSPAAFIVKP